MKILEAREAAPEMAQVLARADLYKKMDDRAKDEERRKASDVYKAFCEMENLAFQREKMIYPMF
jgi:hypothetical protein